MSIHPKGIKYTLPVEGSSVEISGLMPLLSPRAKRNPSLHLIHSTVCLHLISRVMERVWEAQAHSQNSCAGEVGGGKSSAALEEGREGEVA